MKLIDNKKIVIIAVSIVLGVIFFLASKYFSIGKLEIADVIGAIIALIMGLVISIIVIRYANKED